MGLIALARPDYDAIFSFGLPLILKTANIGKPGLRTKLLIPSIETPNFNATYPKRDQNLVCS